MAGFLLQRCACPDIRKPHALSFRPHSPWRHNRAQPYPDGAADARAGHARARANARHGQVLRAARERGVDHCRGNGYQPRRHGLANPTPAQRLPCGHAQRHGGRFRRRATACGQWLPDRPVPARFQQFPPRSRQAARTPSHSGAPPSPIRTCRSGLPGICHWRRTTSTPITRRAPRVTPTTPLPAKAICRTRRRCRTRRPGSALKPRRRRVARTGPNGTR